MPVAKRGMANASGAIIELSNYLEQRISQKSAEFAAVNFTLTKRIHLLTGMKKSHELKLMILFVLHTLLSLPHRSTKSVKLYLLETALPVYTVLIKYRLERWLSSHQVFVVWR